MVNTIKGRRWNDLGILCSEISHASTHPNPNPSPTKESFLNKCIAGYLETRPPGTVSFDLMAQIVRAEEAEELLSDLSKPVDLPWVTLAVVTCTGEYEEDLTGNDTSSFGQLSSFCPSRTLPDMQPAGCLGRARARVYPKVRI